MIIGVDFVDLDFFLFFIFFIVFVKMRNSKFQTPVPVLGMKVPVLGYRP